MSAKEQELVYTIGYGGRKPYEFVQLLKDYGIEIVADVRITPHRASMGSYVLAKSPQKGIQNLLGQFGIDYEWLKELGNPEPKDPDMTHYRTAIAAELPQRTKRLVSLASQYVTCLLCAEKNPAQCHRSIIADFLRGEGWTVSDIV